MADPAGMTKTKQVVCMYGCDRRAGWFNSWRNMRTGRSISMDSDIWTKVGKVSESETEGDVSAAVELLLREAIGMRED